MHATLLTSSLRFPERFAYKLRPQLSAGTIAHMKFTRSGPTLSDFDNADP